MFFWLTGIVLSISCLFGGGTRAEYAGDAAAQLLSIPLLVTALWPALSAHDEHRHNARIVAALLCGIAFVMFLQLLPLPFGHSADPLLAPAEGQQQAESPLPPWMPLSRAPQAAWAAAASLIVPLGVFGGVMRLGLSERLALCWLVLALGGLSLFLGFAQVAQGPHSQLRFYSITNFEDAVGLFANRNHFAAHLYVTLALAAMWFQLTAANSLQRKAIETRSILLVAAAAAFLVAIVGGLAFSRSRAGMILAGAALAGIAAIALTQHSAHDRKEQRSSRTATLAVLGFAAVFTILFGLDRLAARFESGEADVRGALSQTTFVTGLKMLPFGAGLGSFVPVYAAVEKTEDLSAAYTNRAHNDLAELFLETGLLGLVFLLVFLVWFGRRARAVWFDGGERGDPLQGMLDKTATIVIALLLAHSLADYPLRTTSLSAIFAFFCAILAAPASARVISEPPRSRQRSRQPGLEPALAAAPREKWEGPVEWTETWKRAEK